MRFNEWLKLREAGAGVPVSNDPKERAKQEKDMEGSAGGWQGAIGGDLASVGPVKISKHHKHKHRHHKEHE